MRRQLQRAIRRQIIPLMSIQGRLPVAGSVLEIGCGEGIVLELLPSTVGPVVGIDLDTEKLEIARSRLCERNYTLEKADAFEYLDRHPERRWDSVLLVDTLSSFSANRQFDLLDRCIEVLSSDGQLLLKTIDGDAGWKTRFSELLSGLIYRRLKYSQSHNQSFHYLSKHELTAHLTHRGVSLDVFPLHQMLHHPVPHMLYLIKRGAS